MVNEVKRIKIIYNEQDIKNILKNLREIKYGSITLVIQDSNIIQIETNEKIRIKK